MVAVIRKYCLNPSFYWLMSDLMLLCDKEALQSHFFAAVIPAAAMVLSGLCILKVQVSCKYGNLTNLSLMNVMAIL
jgi:hypothetical protein